MKPAQLRATIIQYSDNRFVAEYIVYLKAVDWNYYEQ